MKKVLTMMLWLLHPHPVSTSLLALEATLEKTRLEINFLKLLKKTMRQRAKSVMSS